MERKTSLTAFNIFNEVRLQDEHTDVIIRVNDTEFKLHKIIMCGCSPYFRALFSTSWNNGAEHFYNIPGISPEMMRLVIEYAYTRSVIITEDNVIELLVAADQFLVSGLVDACCEFLRSQLSPENCISICRFTKPFLSCSDLHNTAQLYILQHFEEVLWVSEEFLELPLEDLLELIGRDELNAQQEYVVFEAIIRWIDYAPENRRTHIATLLPKVRMGLMTANYFMNNVKCHPLVMDNEACTPIIISAMQALFDLSMDRPSSLTSPLTRPRLPSEILLAMGGWSGGGPTNRIEAYDVRADCWVSVSEEDEGLRAYHGSVFLDGFVYCIGGFDSVNYFNSVRKFSPITQTWFEVAPMYERRCYVSVAVLDGFIYAIGGHDGHERLKTAERYDSQSNQWMQISPMHERRSDASATSLQGRVYICGGFTGVECLFSAESFNPQTNQWSLIAPMRNRRSGVGVIAYGNLVYAVGGFDGVSRLRSAETYSPHTDRWHDAASMLNPRSNFGIDVVDGRLFVVGGFNGFSTTSDVESFDEKTGEWSDVCDMSIFRSALSCCVLSGLAHVKQFSPRDAVQMLEQQSDRETLNSSSNHTV